MSAAQPYVCFAPKATELLRSNEMTLRANRRLPTSLDHLVGAR